MPHTNRSGVGSSLGASSYTRLLSKEQIVEYRYCYSKFVERTKLKRPLVLDLGEVQSFIKFLGLVPNQSIIQSICQLRVQCSPPVMDESLVLEVIGRMSVEEQLQSEVRGLFQFFDKSAQNKLSAVHLIDGLKRLRQKLPFEKIDQIMIKYDLDGDGYLNYEQFLLLMLCP